MSYTKQFTSAPEHIDELGHVNNAVWLQWVQDVAVEHWNAVGDPAHRDAFFWVVTRHEIDYRGNIGVGENVTANTWIAGEARGATSMRRVDFMSDAGKKLVSAATTWAMLDKATQRLVRVRPEHLAAFWEG